MGFLKKICSFLCDYIYLSLHLPCRVKLPRTGPDDQTSCVWVSPWPSHQCPYCCVHLILLLLLVVHLRLLDFLLVHVMCVCLNWMCACVFACLIRTRKTRKNNEEGINWIFSEFLSLHLDRTITGPLSRLYCCCCCNLLLLLVSSAAGRTGMRMSRGRGSL